jgi:DNA-binding NarL/FixJ family response regulator
LLRIQLAEDHADLAQMLRALLGAQPGWCCAPVVASGEALLEQARAQGADAYVLDLMLADGSVLPRVPALRACQPDAVIIAYSGRGDAELAQACLQAGCNAVVVKDGRVEPLLQALREQLG